jgi:predicted ArsR family transcriptional regulator
MSRDAGKKTTRRALLEALKTGGPAKAEDLARPLQITPMAVRQHLYALAEEGLVDHEAAPVGVGRPAKLWRLTEAANRHFPDAHAELSVSLIDLMRQTFGEEGLEKLIAARTRDQVSDYRSRIGGAQDLGERITALAEIRSAEGYMAEAARDGDAWLLVERHCPICVAAAQCTGICASEKEVFRAVVGSGYHVERLEHVLGGSHRCVYRFSEAR